MANPARAGAAGAAGAADKTAGAGKTASADAAMGQTTTPPRHRGPTRAERQAAAEKARRRRTLGTRTAIAGGVALAVAVVSFVFISNNRDQDKAIAALETASCRYDDKSDSDAGPGRNHTANPTYRVDPPAGGDHSPAPAPAGIYTDQNKPSDGELVHSLEHGYVVVWYRPDVSADGRSVLEQVVKLHARDVLLVPRASMDKPVAATAWHARLLCGASEGASLERFINDNVNQGPEKIPH